MNIQRLVNIPKSRSFFLFGARGTGKSTFLKSSFNEETTCFFDLLLPSIEERFFRSPESLVEEIDALPTKVDTIVLDEIQKLPKLLDVIQSQIEKPKNRFRFIMTGSSGRKLRHGAANLLAGRASVRDIFPFTSQELGQYFLLEDALAWGTLPTLLHLESVEEKKDYLRSYVRTYISEEIQREQIVRNIDPFRKFLEVAAQYNGKIINASKIARGIGVDSKTVASYYSILEDTLIGHTLLAFDFSFRKRLIKSPKFYFFDVGVARAVALQLGEQASPSTSYFGDLFEQYLVTQVVHLLKHKQSETKLSYYLDENDIEVDLVFQQGTKLKFVEIKSAVNVRKDMLSNLEVVAKDFPNAAFEVWSRDDIEKKIGKVRVIPWWKGIEEIG